MREEAPGLLVSPRKPAGEARWVQVPQNTLRLFLGLGCSVPGSPLRTWLPEEGDLAMISKGGPGRSLGVTEPPWFGRVSQEAVTRCSLRLLESLGRMEEPE